jgi:hypothetical protein
MAQAIAEEIGKIRDFQTLLAYLQESLDWPIDMAEVDELTFEYQPEELGLDEECKVKIREIKHLRPFTTNQPWGVFWIEFENRQLRFVFSPLHWPGGLRTGALGGHGSEHKPISERVVCGTLQN